MKLLPSRFGPQSKTLKNMECDKHNSRLSDPPTLLRTTAHSHSGRRKQANKQLAGPHWMASRDGQAPRQMDLTVELKEFIATSHKSCRAECPQRNQQQCHINSRAQRTASTSARHHNVGQQCFSAAHSAASAVGLTLLLTD
ncbi:unnamed protein product [Ceratitis capitata]|uniref:(Mediterranean fruit fly) hypothetical protein n=1 Tax=Ceratitis capitata TaxID=7213 RepID=A0A811V1M7_CERCA|nr:unnamed protein product [Ceratitis capitata]